MLTGKKLTRFFLVSIILQIALLSFSPTVAAPLEVPAQYPTIGEALDLAQPGDVIKVAPGRYYETGLKLPGGVTLAGQGQTPAETIIDGQLQDRILSAQYLDAVSFIQDLTFTNGHAQRDEGYEDSGGAIFTNGGILRIMNCRFIGNRAQASGGAIRCMMTSPLIINCHFEDNEAVDGGGALDCSYQASPIVQNSVFVHNSASYGGALACRGASQPLFSNCRFDENQTEGEVSHGGAVLSFFWGQPKFTQCTFSRNAAELGGGLYAGVQSPTHLTSCTVVANMATTDGAGIYTEDSSPIIETSIIAFHNGTGVLSEGRQFPAISCTNIFGNTGGDWVGNIAPQLDGGGNMSVDPLFCTVDLDLNYMFNLQDDSPCTQAAGACVDLGAWPVGCDTPMSTITVGAFSVDWSGGVPVISWQVELVRTPVDFRLARASLDAPLNETDIPISPDTNGQYSAHDTEFAPLEGADYFYRLYMVFDMGPEVLLASIPLGDRPPVWGVQNLGAFPNPFNPQTTIHFELGSAQAVRAELYGIDGRRVRTLAHEMMPAGPHELVWNGRDDNGRSVSSGTYFVVVKGDETPHTIKVMLLK